LENMEARMNFIKEKEIFFPPPEYDVKTTLFGRCYDVTKTANYKVVE